MVDKTFKKPELLSPAGTWDALKAGVANGADGVYLGTGEFNARLNAANFTAEDLGKAVEYCHRSGVRLYLTLNTLVKNSEISHFFQVLSRVYALGVDGIIIQQFSFLDIIKNNFPGLAVFLSTQAGVGNAGSAALFRKADRIILPREMPIDEVKEIVASGAPVETFVHGALCFSYSGQCLFSSFVDNRSGNRGSCAQLCRQKYNGTYPLSTKELCLVENIPELIEAGIAGFKIEGRMRSPLYVAVATRLYRKAIDSYFTGNFVVPVVEKSEIEVVFNRQFTRGFLGGETDIISPEKPMNRGAFLGTMQNNLIVLERDISAGDGIGIWQDSGVTGTVVRQILKSGTEVKSARPGEKVNLGVEAADGARLFLTSSSSIKLQPAFNVEKKPITIAARKIPSPVKLPELVNSVSSGLQVLVKAYSLAEAAASSRAGADVVFYDIFALDFPKVGGWREKADCGAYLPRIMNNAELKDALKLIAEKQPAAVLTGNLGLLAHRGEFKGEVFLDYSLNAFNDLDMDFFAKYKAVPVLSPELSLNEMGTFKNKNAAILCHGDLVLVNTMIEIAETRLVNDKGAVFPVRQEAGYRQILNSRPYGLFNDVRRLYELGYRRFLIDSKGKGEKYAALYRRMLNEDVSDRRLRKGHTSGHLFRPVP